MNTQRVIVLGIALVAAGGAVLLVRGMMGGGTPKVEARTAPAAIAMSEVLVASTNLQPGQAITPDQVRWERWPTASVDASFITHAATGSEEQAVKGTVARAPILQNQPIATTAIVHADAAGFMAATLQPGMRAVSITISADSGAGGFILPNDRVDVILTRKLDGTPPRSIARTILSDLRVLAVDQTFRWDKDTKTVIGKTATLEVTPRQAMQLSSAASAGQLSLSLRPLTDGDALARNDDKHDSGDMEGPVTVIRYGIAGNKPAPQETPQ